MGLDMTEPASDWAVRNFFNEAVARNVEKSVPDTHMVGVIFPEHDRQGTSWGHEKFLTIPMRDFSGTAETDRFNLVADAVRTHFRRSLDIVRVLDLSKPYEDARVVRPALNPIGAVK